MFESKKSKTEYVLQIYFQILSMTIFSVLNILNTKLFNFKAFKLEFSIYYIKFAITNSRL